MTKYRQLYSTRQNPQSEPIPGTTQIANSAGGFAWGVDDWMRLDRFLILGSEGGTYYINPRKLTRENAEAVTRCAAADGKRTVDRIVEVSAAGRAPKNDPALFALAICAAAPDEATRQYALDMLPRVARIGTHLFHFLEYIEGFRGWGRSLRRGIGGWYTNKTPAQLAYQAIKYQQRDGWSHRDALRLAHPVPPSDEHNAIFNWIVNAVTPGHGVSPGLQQIRAFELAKEADDILTIIHLIKTHNLPREAIPTQWLKELPVWEALFEKMPMMAMVRNLGTMTANGFIKPLSDVAKEVVDRLSDPERIAISRLHPISILSALLTYQQGHGVRGRKTWTPVGTIIDALDAAFYLAFGNVASTGKSHLLALDISGSMGWSEIAGVPGLTPRMGSAAMALVTAATEPNSQFVGFATQLTPLNITPRQRLDDVVREVSRLPMGVTDIAAPMNYALKNGMSVDTFVVYTDNETWAGNIHPSQALRIYREKTGIPAKLVVVGMQSNGFTIADPDDAGMMDVVGFDTATPRIISDFVANVG